MRLLCLLLCLICTSASARAADSWEPLGTTAGVAVQRKTMADSPLFAFRGEGTFEVPIGLLITVLKTPDLAVEWVDLMTAHKVVRPLTPDQNLIYESYGLPWPLSDRDYLMTETLRYDEARRAFTIDYASVEDASMPPKADHVRARAFRTFWRLTMLDANRTQVEVEVFTDPMGALPAWMVNLIQKDWPWKTIDGLVGRAKRGDIRPDPGVAAWGQ